MKRLLFVLIFFMLAISTASAQGIITYGTATVSTLSAENPIAIFTFQGAEDDQVTIQAIAITPGLNLSVTLQSGAEILATNDNDPYTAGATDARVDARLPAANAYLILVSSVGGQTGDYLLKLTGQAQAAKTVVTGSPADINVLAGTTTYYSFTADPVTSTTASLSTTTPNFEFVAILRNDAGQVVSASTGTAATMTVPAGDGTYEIAISSPSSTAEGVVNVVLALGDAPVASPPDQPAPTQPAPDPLVTEEVQPPPADGACVVSTTGGVNIRQGPGTEYNIVGQMTPGQNYTVTGIYQGWYTIDVPGLGTGWVAGSVVQTGGNCANVPPASPPANNNVQQPTATYTQPAQNNQPTATYTPSYTPTTANVQQPTATYTPSYTPTTPAPQIAPQDANKALTIPLDNTASVLDFVSYPEGDTEDRVSYDVSGMNNNVAFSGGQARLVISVSCFGTGTEHITFFTGGQTYSCGDTVVDRTVTADSRTGSVLITAVGGEGTYVQWVLTGTATRTN